jgi:hypothetical protein
VERRKQRPLFPKSPKVSMERCVTSHTSMEQLGKLVQLHSLHTLACPDEEYMVTVLYSTSYDALSNLQSLHTLECERDWIYVKHHLACIPMENLQILKSGDLEVIEALSTADPSVQLKELWLTHYLTGSGDHSLLWNYLATVTSLIHLSLPHLRRTPSYFPFSRITLSPYLCCSCSSFCRSAYEGDENQH